MAGTRNYDFLVLDTQQLFFAPGLTKTIDQAAFDWGLGCWQVLLSSAIQ